MNLHTKDHVDPVARLIAQAKWLHWWVLRLIVLASRDSWETEHKDRYVAASLIRPRKKRWPQKMQDVHKLIVNPADPQLVGQTFRDYGMNVVQNRLLLARRVPFLFIPAYLRRLLLPSVRELLWWSVEAYTLYVVVDGEMYFYGTFVEIAPADRTFHARQELGFEWVWRLCGRGHRFATYLQSVIPAQILPIHVRVAKRARLLGCAMAMPMFYVLSLLIRRICYKKVPEPRKE